LGPYYRCAQYLIDRALPFLALDADGSHGALLRHYADYTRQVDLERSESVDEILTLATESDRRVLVDLPSQSDRPLSKWIAEAGLQARDAGSVGRALRVRFVVEE
jgi:hypothetical protein